MIIKPLNDVPKEPVTVYGSTKTTIQWFRKPSESTHFMLRRFEIGPHGQIGIHSHPEEHQMFILKGPIELLNEKGEKTVVESNQFVYMPPNEPHGYNNPNEYTVELLCGIPKLNSD
ncbi:MAG: cupin domain-containing protein [Candidatus Lokiarchaeota archaeon]|nr:cupin domain-containing protein [Candidatus Harpocratesius repetitus]